MRKIILVALAVCGFMQPAYAEIEEAQYDEELQFQSELSYVRPGPRPGRPGPYPGPPRRPEPPRPSPRPRPPAPHPGYPQPHPGYPPPPPDYGRIEYYRCDSYGPNNYYQCYIGYGNRSVRLIQQHSWESCVYGRSYGIMSDRIWVNHGCKATFEIVRY